jgi:calcineurin-like phosphoesterase family protein
MLSGTATEMLYGRARQEPPEAINSHGPMTTYFTADQHFGHQNIIGYCNRPFHSVGEMNAVLVANWNAVVGPHDTVHVLGDVAMGRREESMPLIGRLAGHKILYPGNHDRCWYGHGERALRLEQEYLDAGFDAIRQGPLTMTVGDREVLVCHLPYQGDSGETERYAKFRPLDEGMWLLHGHVHEKWRQQGRMVNVGVDVWDFTPVAEEVIARLMDGTLLASA